MVKFFVGKPFKHVGHNAMACNTSFLPLLTTVEQDFMGDDLPNMFP